MAIGAVNTIIRLPGGALRGDNTDWLGIRELIAPCVPPRGGRALVVGAGGTAMSACYCAQQLGLELLVYNRTADKAVKLAQRFGGRAVLALDADTLGPIDAIISTVPAASNFAMPDPDWLARHRPVVLDAAYRPRRTVLLVQAAQAGSRTLEGIDMLVEQGVKQMELWTGKPAPRHAMDQAARAFYDASDPARASSGTTRTRPAPS
jgi:shikimate 5-dehydrogenase